jgi:hypothetical protein
MYTYTEFKEALLATLVMVNSDRKNEDYIDSLSKAALVMSDDDQSFKVFTKFFNVEELVTELASLNESR